VAIFEPIFDALNQAGVRYVVVGGVAVVLHGFARLTGDVDVVVDLDPPQALKAIDALVALGLRPRAPVDPRAFADPAQRTAWARDKGMRVFAMHDPQNPMREVDLFVEAPLPFEELWARAKVIALGPTHVRIAAIDDLIAMKRQAGRPEDQTDVEALQRIAEGTSRGRP
jgi:predicted nucleotidyltransferase